MRDRVAPQPRRGRATPSPSSPEPVLEWNEDDVPKINYDDLASRVEVQDVETAPAADEPEPRRVEPAPERTEESLWWTSPEEPDPTPPPAEPMRGAWEPPRQS